jgi:hypothetical protein
MALVHVQSVRRHLVDTMSPEQFQTLGVAMEAVRDSILGSGALPSCDQT